MKVGISTSVIQRGKTGIARHLFSLLPAMVAASARDELSLFVLEEDLPLFDFLGSSVRLVAVPERFRSPVRNIFWHQTAGVRWAKKLGLDVLHVPSYRRMLWPKPCALVATIHDLAPYHVSKKYDWKRMLYARVVVRRLARRQDRIIAVSQNTIRDILQFFELPPGRLQLVYNGIEHERFFPADEQTAAAAVERRFGLKQPYFLYVARLEHPGKNHVRLIEAFNRLKSRTHAAWKLAIGGSDWHGAEVIHEAARRSPYAGDIRFLGFVAEAELPNLYRAAGVFVYPSLYEGFGLPPLEAMACGCPVVSSANGSLGEVLGKAAAIIDPENVENIAEQLTRVATDAGLRGRLRQAGFGQAGCFSWEKAAQETLAVYQDACRLGRSPSGLYASARAQQPT